MREALRQELDELREAGLYRTLRRGEGAPGPHICLDGRELLNLGSNNYLGLTEHPRVREAAREAIERWGTGASGSRLTSGNLALHEELEAELARLKGSEAALLFPSGYQANVGTIPALVGPGDLILSDQLNHASIIDGSRLSRAEVRVYAHGSVSEAERLLADRAQFRRVLVVTDGVFSMDGDLAPLVGLADLCKRHRAWLMVDDAHGTGVLGETGAGSAEHLGVHADIQMGTLSKALGAEGGFVAGSTELIDLLRNRARSFIYSTGPAPATTAAAVAALRVLREEPERRAAVQRHAQLLRGRLRDCGLNVPEGVTPIVPLMIGSAQATLGFAKALEQRGIWSPAIRPPTVPEGTGRLRLTVTASHSEAELGDAAAKITQVAREVLA